MCREAALVAADALLDEAPHEIPAEVAVVRNLESDRGELVGPRLDLALGGQVAGALRVYLVRTGRGRPTRDSAHLCS